MSSNLEMAGRGGGGGGSAGKAGGERCRARWQFTTAPCEGFTPCQVVAGDRTRAERSTRIGTPSVGTARRRGRWENAPLERMEKMTWGNEAARRTSVPAHARQRPGTHDKDHRTRVRRRRESRTLEFVRRYPREKAIALAPCPSCPRFAPPSLTLPARCRQRNAKPSPIPSEPK